MLFICGIYLTSESAAIGIDRLVDTISLSGDDGSVL